MITTIQYYHRNKKGQGNFMSSNDYYVGLDIGTNSVGWAVTDTNLNLIKVKGKRKNFWGAHLFTAGKTAKKRRVYRSTRRRYDRRAVRISLLREIFDNNIKEIDPEFFDKMSSSWVHPEDSYRNKIGDYIFGADQKEEKEEYYKKYPTIWHLRKELVYSHKKKDLRLVYLAIHHIIKHRGNFLYTDNELKNLESNISDVFSRVLNIINQFTENPINIEKTRTTFIEILSEPKNRNEQRDALYEQLSNGLSSNDKKIIKNLINILLGYKIDLKNLLMLEKSVKTYLFDLIEGDNKYEEVMKSLGENGEIIDLMQQIYSWTIMNQLMPPEIDYISDAYVQIFEDYKKDLKSLKRLFKKCLSSSEYDEFFRNSSIKGSFASYNQSKKETPLNELYKTIDKKLKPFLTDDKFLSNKDYQRYIERAENDKFLQVINTSNKGAIPHQFHKDELEAIINNQGEYYPFLKDNKEKVIKILTFRIPYYVGPLNPLSSFAWIKREDEKIFPWNFEDIVDLEISEEKFITRMIKSCTYLVAEEALPLESLLYQEYKLLNELNKVKVDGQLIERQDKLKLLNDLFKKKRSVNKGDLKKWFEINYGENRGYDIIGLSQEDNFNNQLSSWKTFTDLGYDLDNAEVFKMAENIIKWGTIFSDVKTKQNRISKNYPNLSKEEINTLSRLKFRGWGRLSRKFLYEVRFKLPNETSVSIIERLRATNDNLMQIINNQELGIKSQLDKHMQESIEKKLRENNVTDEVDAIPGSPAIKKSVRRSLAIVEEITQIMGGEPKKIFIEMARGEISQPKRTKSRYDRLKKIYDDLKRQNKIVSETYQELSDKKELLYNEWIYLYFLQAGRCLYSGKPINLDQPQLYEVDHIIPRSYQTDNSFDNKALVLRSENQHKKDDLLIKKDNQKRDS